MRHTKLGLGVTPHLMNDNFPFLLSFFRQKDIIGHVLGRPGRQPSIGC